jgi:hypothetical protein
MLRTTFGTAQDIQLSAVSVHLLALDLEVLGLTEQTLSGLVVSWRILSSKRICRIVSVRIVL